MKLQFQYFPDTHCSHTSCTFQIYKRKGHSLLRMKQYAASKEAFKMCLDMIGKSDMNSKLRDKTRLGIKKQMTVFNVVKELRDG